MRRTSGVWGGIMKAFVLISLDECDEQELLEDLKSEPAIQNAFILFGEWDLVAEVELENAEALGTFVMDNIRKRPEVKLTSSLIVAGR